MDPRFAPHNSHLEDPAHFADRDPQLGLLKRQAYVNEPQLLEDLPSNTPGIYTVGGGRQIGKTTLLKQWMLRLLKAGVPPIHIAFFSGELIDDHHSLLQIFLTRLKEIDETDGSRHTRGLLYFILDEVTYIKDWDKAIKYMADAGMLKNMVLILTGSDLVMIQEARMRFPGRRGEARQVDFHLYPLSFRECVLLKHKSAGVQNAVDLGIEQLWKEFDAYLIHGGFLTAINDMALHQRIRASTLNTYSDWIRGDMLKRGKAEHFLREVLGAIVKRYTSQVTWNALAKDLSIDHPKTVHDYVSALEYMDVVGVQHALIEDKLVAAPKTSRKISFRDPFIYHAIYSWLRPSVDPFEQSVLPLFANPERTGQLVEAAVAEHFRRQYPTYFIKAEGEVDVAYVKNDRFWPVEVKWSNQLRREELKQILKYPNGQILTRSNASSSFLGLPVIPIVLALA